MDVLSGDSFAAGVQTDLFTIYAYDGRKLAAKVTFISNSYC